MKFLIDQAAFDALPDALKTFYTKRDSDGKYVLQVEGAVPQDKFVEFRDNNIELKRQVDGFKSLGMTVEELQALVAKKKDIEDGKTSDGRKVAEIIEERVSAMKKTSDAAIQERDAKLAKTRAELEKLKIGGAATKKALELGLRPEAADDLVARVSNIFYLEDDGRVGAKKADGQPLYSAKTGEVLTLDEYVAELPEKAAHLFAPSTGGGGNPGGNGNQRRPPGTPAINPWKKETSNLTEQGRIFRTNPDLAKRLAAEAGVKLPERSAA